ncbi:hypothetical protein B566_EDAN013124 [Ephemera danica]|nr:hypothetical protein B566_EDAN013124 [Ephemera danica]
MNIGLLLLLLIIVPQYNDTSKADLNISSENVAISNVTNKNGYNETCKNVEQSCTEVDSNMVCNQHTCLCKDGFEWTGKKCKKKKDGYSWMWILWVILAMGAITLLSALCLLIGICRTYGRSHSAPSTTWSSALWNWLSSRHPH